jgi:hypothetical protein
MIFAQPVITDLVVTANNVGVIAIRDRGIDMVLSDPNDTVTGDILAASVGVDGTWSVVPEPELYHDKTVYDEAVVGGLALYSGGSSVVAGAMETDGVFDKSDMVGLLWYDLEGGLPRDSASIAHCTECAAPFHQVGGMTIGDVEAVCAPPTTPTPTPTSTRPTTATPTSTNPPPTPTSGDAVGRAYLPAVLDRFAISGPGPAVRDSSRPLGASTVQTQSS